MNWFDITSRLVVVVVVNFSEADVIAEYAGDGGDCGRTMVSLSFCCSSSAIRLTATVVFIGLMRDKKKHIRGCNEQKILTSIPITWDRELDYGWTIMIQSNFNQLFHWLSWHYWWWLLVMMMMMMMTMTTMVVVTIFTTTAMTIYVYIYSKKKEYIHMNRSHYESCFNWKYEYECEYEDKWNQTNDSNGFIYPGKRERERGKRKIPILFIQALDGSNR